MLLEYEINYGLEGATDFLIKWSEFAASCGWEVDHLTDNQLQLYSEGWGSQSIIYRFETAPYDVDAYSFRMRGVAPTGRETAFSLSGAETFAIDTTVFERYEKLGLPEAPTTVYFFGSKQFLAVVFHITPSAVLTICCGTINLFEGWRSYENGLYFFWALSRLATASSSLSYLCWYNVESDPSTFNHPMGEMNRTFWFEEEARTSGSTSNYQMRYDSGTNNTLVGNYNAMFRFLTLNNFSGMRTAFYPTWFVRDVSNAYWYPLGLSPVAFIYGEGLRIGGEVVYGNEKYIVFPILLYQFRHWQAFRIE